MPTALAILVVLVLLLVSYVALRRQRARENAKYWGETISGRQRIRAELRRQGQLAILNVPQARRMRREAAREIQRSVQRKRHA